MSDGIPTVGFEPTTVTEPHSGKITGHVTLRLEEGDRQLTLMALAHLSLKRPGFDWTLNRLALLIDNDKDGRAELYDAFVQLAKGERDLEREALALAFRELMSISKIGGFKKRAGEVAASMLALVPSLADAGV